MTDQEPHLFEQFQTGIVFHSICTACSSFDLHISLYSLIDAKSVLNKCNFVECNLLVQFAVTQSTFN